MSGCASGCGTCGVRLRHAGKLLHAEVADLDVKSGDRVVVQLDRGQALARVVAPSHEPKNKVPVHRLLRKAKDEDLAREQRNKQRAEAALKLAEQKLRRRRIDVRLVEAEYQLDGSRVEIFYLSEERHVPSDLGAELSAELKAHVELKPLGPRDRVKHRGAVGVCGRETCCSSWMEDFHPVSVKMAKLQDFSLNETRLMGVCGRLKCCLAYENAHYESVKREMPKVGAFVDTEQGEARVWTHHVLRRSISVRLADGTQIELPIPEGGFPKGRRSPGQGAVRAAPAAAPAERAAAAPVEPALAPVEEPAESIAPPAALELPVPIDSLAADGADDGEGLDGDEGALDTAAAGTASAEAGAAGAPGEAGGQRRRRRRRRRRGGGGPGGQAGPPAGGSPPAASG